MKRIDVNMPDGKKELAAVFSRSQTKYREAQITVEKIVDDVRANGDKALFEYTFKFDKVRLDKDSVIVSDKEIKEAYDALDKRLLDVIRRASKRIRDYHERQKKNSWFDLKNGGEMLGQLVRPLDRVGVYVPGGKASYPSSVLMNIIPASVAGVGQLIMATPAGPDARISPAVLVAANEACADKIYKIGGAQAVAALAFGTETIPRTDKITGPGNIYVSLAKKAVYGQVGIDSIAGPSEILIIADSTANPAFIAADMISQAEHDELASSILLCTDAALADEVTRELDRQTALLDRKEIIKKSLDGHGAIIKVDSLTQAADISNEIAPEHLEICTGAPMELLPQIRHAGAIFLGHYTPEPLGDYMAGPNHVLPTNGTARFFSPLCVDDFTKRSSILSFSEESFKALSKDVIDFADAEGLQGHANAVKIRLDRTR